MIANFAEKMGKNLRKAAAVLMAVALLWGAAPAVAEAASSSMTVTATSLDAVDLAYIYVKSNDNSSDLELIPLESGESFYQSQFSYSSFMSSRNNYGGYVVFFVKPQQGRLLTKLYVSNSQPQLYPIDKIATDSNIKGYHRINEMVAEAKDKGYIAGFGFSRTSTSTGSSSFTVSSTGTNPILHVIAESSVPEAKEGDSVTFTVKITPEVPGIPSSEIEISDFEIDTLTLNNKTVSSGNYSVNDNGDGTYTVTVTHTVTEQDERFGAVSLEVAASADFTYNLNLGISGFEAMSTSRASASATSYVPIAQQFTVSYDWSNAPANVSLPNGGVAMELPANSSYRVDATYGKGSSVEGWDGDWIFSGWMLDGEVVSGDITVNRNIVLTGNWTFDGDEHTVIFNEGDALGGTFADKVYSLPVHNGVATLAGAPDISDDLYRNYSLTGWRLVSGGGGNWDVGELYQPEDLVGATVYGDMTFSAEYAIQYRASVYVVLDGHYDSSNHSVDGGEFVSIERVLGPDAELRLHNADTMEEIELVRGTDENGNTVYYADVENGTYHVLYYNGEEWIEDGANDGQPQQLDIRNEDRSRYLFFYSLGYELRGGRVDEPLPTTYYRFGENPVVSTVVPELDGYRFTGWLLEANDSVYDGGDTLPQIMMPLLLTAQYELDVYAYVNLHLTVDCRTNIPANVDGNNIRLELTYNDGENYVEVFGKDAKYVNFADWHNHAGGGTVSELVLENVFADLDIDEEYSLNLFLKHYDITSKYVELTYEEGNYIYNVYATMTYTPGMFDLQWTVRPDASVAEELIPQAVDVKVISYNYPVNNKWSPISAHINGSVDAELNGYGAIVDSYEVPQILPFTVGNSNTAYFRVAAAGFTVKDANGKNVELTASSADGKTFTSNAAPGYPAGAYTAELVVDGTDIAGNDLAGVYYVEGNDGAEGAQQGTLQLVVYAHPHSVTLDLNYGYENNTLAILRNLFVMPDLGSYQQPQREGYTFGGWYTSPACADGEEYLPGAELNNDVTLYAKWKPHRDISGTVTIEGFYLQPTLSGDFSMQLIPEGERVTAATVVLQHINENGYATTVRSETITFGEYSGDAPKATGTFEFAGVPDDGHEHRILVLAHNYDDAYQNEPQSLSLAADAAAYGNTADDYLVVYGDDLEGVVNAYLTFDPERYYLNWIVDASAVAPAYRPDYAEICVRYYDGANANDPQSWPIISQMVFGDKHIGATGSFDGDGKLNDSLKVWNTEPDGTTQYRYTVSLHGLEDAYYDYSNVAKYFDVTYSNQGAHFVGSTPNVTPTITITPKQFDITYDLQTTETVVGMNYAPAKHTYGVITDLDDAYPFRSGYAFRGWYTDAACTEGNQVQRIPAATAENTTLYAKWVKTQDVVNVTVTLNHATVGGDKGSIPDAFTLQLTSAVKGSNVFSDEPGMSLVVLKDKWYDYTGAGDVQDVYTLSPAWSGLTSEQAYNANIFMHDYVVTGKTVTSTTENGVTTYNVDITMQYTPDLLDLKFGVEIHADDLDLVELWPVSAEVKVTSWYQRDESDTLKWQTIQQHDETTITIPLNYDGEGSAKYPVWLGTENASYYYRMKVVAITLNDGTVVPMYYHNTDGHDHYHSQNEIYQAEIVVDGGTTPTGSNYAGVFGTEADGKISQVGTVKAVISINPHYVELDPQGGTIPGEDAGVVKFEDLIYMPALNSYKPVRDGYTFDGWYRDADCNNTDEVTGTALVVPAERSVLTKDITLYAKWTPISYTITWMRDGGSWVGNYTPITSYTINDVVTMPGADEISRADHLFEGWYEYGKDSNVLISQLSNTYGNKTFAAKWALDVWADGGYSESDSVEADSLTGGDGIPDKYQAVIYYQVDDGGTAVPTFEVVTVMNGGQPAASGTVVAGGATASPKDGYAFDSWDNDYNATFEKGVKSATTGEIRMAAEGGKTYTFTAYCGVDTNDDGKPDMYQLAVTFRVENGTWADGKTDDKVVWLDRLSDGNLAVNGVAHLKAEDIPSGMKPINQHYGSADWSPYAPTTTQAFDHNFTFRYVFAETIYTITYDDAVKYDHGTFNTTDANIASGKSIKLIFDNGAPDEERTINGYTRLERPTRDGYTFIGWQRTLNTDADGAVDADMPQIFTAVWEIDVWNDAADSISSGDNIPDKYQVAVLYKAGVGGTVDAAAQVFTLETADAAKYAESGSVTADGATAVARSGYAFDIWSNPCGADFNVESAAIDQLTIPTALGGHSYTFTASFATDTWKDGGNNIGDDSVNSGDGVPDYKQAAFYFNAAANGRLTDGDVVAQVFTLTRANGDIKYRGTVTPVEVAYQANAGYAFDYWSKGGDINVEVLPFVATAMEGGRSITYTAHFAEDSNGDDKPDKDQVLVRFEVAPGEEGRGSVSGSGLVQVIDDTNVKPSLDNVFVTPNSEYVLDYWTKDNGSTAVNPEADYNLAIGSVTTFYAHFTEDAWADTALSSGTTAFASDGIADKYQYIVVFNIIGCGSHYAEDYTNTVIYTMRFYNVADEHGRITPGAGDAVPTLGNRIPVVSLDAEHKGAWNADVKASTPVSGNATYTFNIADRSKHVVSYNLMGGTPADDVSYAADQVLEGKSHTVKEEPTKAGYDFIGWLSDGTTYQPADVITFVFGMGDLHLVAQWEVETYRIAYEGVDGADGMADAKHTYTVEDAAYTLPTPSKDGFVFEGWYDNAGFSGEAVNVQVAGETGDKTYYAKWTKDEWNEKTNDLHSSDGIADYKQGVIEFVVDDAAHGSIDVNATQVFTLVYTLDDDGHGSYAKAVTPAAVTVTAKTGWAFDYWSKGGVKVDPFTAITLHGEETVVYTATFAEDGGDGVPDKYQLAVTFSIENGTWRNDSRDNYTELVTLYDKDGNWAENGVGRLASSQLPQGMVADTHYGNGKWTTNAPTLSLEISPDKNTAFNFAFERLVYKVSYFDGSKMASVDIESGRNIQVNPNSGAWMHDGNSYTIVETLEIVADTTLADASCSGYTFGGWTCADLSESRSASTGYAFTAQWTPINYSITYVENGGADVENATYTIESEDIALPDITKAGYDFKGWYDNADFNGEPVTKVAQGSIGDKTYYAKWEAITYNITYVLNGDTDNPVSWRDPAAVKNTYTVEDEYTLPLPKRDNYGFAGWYEDAQLAGTSVTALQKGSTGNKTYYAKWIADTYTIAYEMNGGSWTQGFTPTTQYTVQSAAITLPTDDNISKTGHVFEGWYLTADFSGERQLVLPQGSNGYQRFYAKWAVDVWADKDAAGSTAAADSDSASDGIADYKQAVVKFEAEDGGILKNNTTQVFTLADAGNGVFSGSVELVDVEIDSNDKIAFDHWADKNGNIVTPFADEVALNGGETVIYTAHFAKDDNDDEIPDYQQIIIHFVAKTNGTVSGNTTQATGKLGIDSTHAVTPTLSGVNVAGNAGYTLDYWTLDAGVQPVDPTATVYFHRGTTHTFYAHFAVDNWDDADDSLEGGDNIPDYKQAVISFRAAANGAVFGAVDQVFTLTDADGDGVFSGSEIPAAITVTPASEYVLDCWKNGESKVQPIGTATALTGGETVTYTAYFAADKLVDAAVTDYNGSAPGDGIADKYQNSVTYKLAGKTDADLAKGSWTGGGTADIVKVFTQAAYHTADAYGAITQQTKEAPKLGAVPEVTITNTVSHVGYWDTAITAETAVTGNATYTFTIEEKHQHTVRYDLNYGDANGVDYTDVLVYHGEGHTAKAAPTRAHYDFKGWSDGSNTYAAGATIANVTGNITLTAQWNPTSYSISYDLNDGAWVGGFAPKTGYTIFTRPVALPDEDDISKTGYTFDGWYAEDNFSGSKVTEVGADAYGDKVFYAKWIPVSYTIIYNENGGSEVADGTYTVESGAIALPTEISRLGYTFGGWYDNAQLNCEAITVQPADATGNKTYYAKWNVVTYNISYNLNDGGSSHDATLPTAKTSYTVEDATYFLPLPTRPGYDFGGWFETVDGAEREVTAIAHGSTGNKAFFAKWVAEHYTITYHNANGATGMQDAKLFYTTDDVKDAPYTLSEPALAGYVFEGWYTDADFTEGNKVTVLAQGSFGNKDFYAKWAEDVNDDDVADRDQVLVYFVSADDTKGTVEGATCKAYTGGTVSVDLDDVTTTPASDYMLDYWKLAGETVTLPDSFSFENGQSYTFTAYWTEDKLNDARDTLTGGDGIADYKQAAVQFTAEQPGGSVSGATTQVFTLTAVNGGYAKNITPATVTVTANDGYAFLNWVRGGVAENPYAGILLRGGDKVSYTARFGADASGDGVPDIRQIFVYFLSADEDEGTVSGSGIEQVFVLPEGATVMDITPSLSDVEVEGETYSSDNIRFYFDYWTMDDGRTAVDPATTLYNVAGNTSIIFYAHFEEELIETRGTVVLTKVDAADEDTVLAGVVFELYDEDDELIGTYTTDEDGEIKVRRMKEGDYYFVEVRPAAGYLLNTEEHHFSIEAAETTKLTVENVRSNVPAGFSTEHYAYIIGYADRTVQPEANITRAEVATIFFRLLDEETRAEYLTRSNNFSDVAADKWYNTAVSTMAAMGVIVGYEDGTFRPDEHITRAEFAAIAARFDDSNVSGEASFSDIYGHWAYREINIAAHNGWILGYTDGTFMPDQAITRAEAMAMVNRVLQRVPENTNDLRRGMIQWLDNQDTGKWYYLTVQEATNSHEYVRKANGYEYWTKLTAQPDWVALEQ